MNESINTRVIAYYLPQFHPIPENDKWWGKGFTEWTNVGKAKPLFPGHYQPRIPADLGYYDLRMPEIREIQANIARKAGIEGFCYYHYWFDGKRLLERPFNEVLSSGKPNYPFCLCWANHSWKEKTWSTDGKDKILIQQTYPGNKDYTDHFYALLPAFKDKRYIRVKNKPLFAIYDSKDIPEPSQFISLWNQLAIKEGLDGIFFAAAGHKNRDIEFNKQNGFDATIYDLMFKRKTFIRSFNFFLHLILQIPYFIDYRDYSKTLLSEIPVSEEVFPCVLPNYDHTPRSNRHGFLFTHSTPANWGALMDALLKKIKSKEEQVIFLKSWNEWGEGNYLEPDLKYGSAYLDTLREILNKEFENQ